MDDGCVSRRGRKREDNGEFVGDGAYAGDQKERVWRFLLLVVVLIVDWELKWVFVMRLSTCNWICNGIRFFDFAGCN